MLPVWWALAGKRISGLASLKGMLSTVFIYNIIQFLCTQQVNFLSINLLIYIDEIEIEFLMKLYRCFS